MATDPTQRYYRAPCPGCGAPVEFKSAQSTHAVCGYCQSTVVRSGDVLTRLGKMAELFDDHSPLQLMASGRIQLDGKDVPFTLIGRLQYKGDAGVWTEWAAFLNDGTLATLGGQKVATQTFTADASKQLTTAPLAVLVNRGTYGAAELAAGAIEGNKRGDVVGERTFGEGSVQKTIELPDGAALLLTVAKYQSPDGKKIQDEAIIPTVPTEQAADDGLDDDATPPPSKDDLPLNKALWTPSYVLWTGGIAVLVLALVHELSDRRSLWLPGRALGLNAMLAYAGSWLMVCLLAAFGADRWLYAQLFERVIADEELGALDRDRLRAVARWLHLLLRALRIDGYRAQGLAHCISMLDQAVETEVGQRNALEEAGLRFTRPVAGQRIELDDRVLVALLRHQVARLLHRRRVGLARRLRIFGGQRRWRFVALRVRHARQRRGNGDGKHRGAQRCGKWRSHRLGSTV